MPGDTGACGHFRLAFPAEAAHHAGLNVKLLQAGFVVTHHAGRRDPNVGGYHVGDIDPVPADVLVVQRAFDVSFVECLEISKRRYGQKIVLDLDDHFHAIHPKNRAYRAVHPTTSPRSNWNYLPRALAVADVVTVTTPELLQRYGGGKGVIVPNRVPRAMLSLEGGDRDEPFVGWSGTIATHPEDLDVTRGAVAKAVPVDRFRVVGDPAGVGRALGWPEDPWGTGWLPFMDYFPTLAAAYDIGIVPLQNSVFNRAKSALKSLENAACGIPSVVSPTYDNLRVAADGIGLVAAKPRQWAGHLRRLLNDDAYRLDLGAQAREAVAAKHTIEGNIEQWIEAWTSALQSPSKTSASRLLLPG